MQIIDNCYSQTITKVIVNSVGLVRFTECNQYQLWNASNGADSNQSVRQNVDVDINCIVILLMYFLRLQLTPIQRNGIGCNRGEHINERKHNGKHIRNR
jgi:hypothetical protein